MTELVKYAQLIENDFDIDVLQNFKEEYKLVRSLVNFIKVHKGDKGVRQLEKSKEVYQTAGAIREAKMELSFLDKNDSATSEKYEYYSIQLEQSKNEWKRNYSKTLFTKLEKELLEFDYRKIRSEFLDNFFTGAFASRLKSRERAES